MVFGVVMVFRPFCFVFAQNFMCRWQTMAKVLIGWPVLRMQNTPSAGEQKATHPAASQGLFLLSLDR